ncbi:MAG TPA: hypothetical protein VFU14_13450 [Acidimicrobiales bacterium]|nr:hypothetical protein [Acidimicrobiales bacterium]
MRRVLLFAAFLVLLGLSTAMAASFEVQAEDITSFTTDVSIDVPDTRTYYLRGAPPLGQLSESPELVSANVYTQALDPGGSLAVDNPDNQEMVWQAVLGTPLTVVSPIVRLYITQTGPEGPITAGLFDCSGSTCIQFGAVTATPAENLATLDFDGVDHTLDAGDVLQLKVVNEGSKSYNIQWGYKANRPARLEIMPS